MTTHVKHGGIFKEVDVIHVKHGGVWKEVSGKRFIPGEPMEGGFFAGFAGFGNNPYALIIADKSAETSLQWKTSNTSSSGTSDLSNGWNNTNAMNDASHPAAKYCRDYNGGGFNDWYLASNNEWFVICRLLASNAMYASQFAPDFRSGGSQMLANQLWSSTEMASVYAHFYTPTSASGANNNSYTSKTTTLTVRPIRRVLI